MIQQKKITSFRIIELILQRDKIKILFLLCLFANSKYYAQEKITEFTTTHSNFGTGNIKLPILFELYDNRLVLNYIDKEVIKQMVKIGQQPTQIFSYQFTKEEYGENIIYKYEDKQIQIMVIWKGNPKPSVTIKSKDSFLGTTLTNQIFFSLLD
jgi:hypothetical protein